MAYVIKNIKQTTLFNKLGSFRKVENMRSLRSSEAVPNQFVLRFKNGEVYQSYDTIIAVKWFDDNAVWVSNQFDCSNTTRNYTIYFLDRDYKTIKKLLERGVYQILNIDSCA